MILEKTFDYSTMSPYLRSAFPPEALIASSIDSTVSWLGRQLKSGITATYDPVTRTVTCRWDSDHPVGDSNELNK